MIEARGKMLLAEEYDAAQERGEVASRGGERSGREHSTPAPSAADIGITRKDIHEARQIRDAEAADPGVTARTPMGWRVRGLRWDADNFISGRQIDGTILLGRVKWSFQIAVKFGAVA